MGMDKGPDILYNLCQWDVDSNNIRTRLRAEANNTRQSTSNGRLLNKKEKGKSSHHFSIAAEWPVRLYTRWLSARRANLQCTYGEESNYLCQTCHSTQKSLSIALLRAAIPTQYPPIQPRKPNKNLSVRDLRPTVYPTYTALALTMSQFFVALTNRMS